MKKIKGVYMGRVAPSLAVLNLKMGHHFILNGFQNTLMARENLLKTMKTFILHC